MERGGEAFKAEEVHAWGAAARAGSGEPAAQAVAQVIYSSAALENLERAVPLLPSENPSMAVDSVRAIQGAVEVLAAASVGRTAR